MTIDRFDQTAFEDALAKVADYLPGVSFYESGRDSEIVYRLQMNGDPIYIQIRSSISPYTGKADESGKDSIRMFLMHETKGLLSRGDTIYTTRVPGWDGRMLDKVVSLFQLWKKSGYCTCGNPTRTYRVNKVGPNHGRLFAKCDRYERKGDGHTWKWIE